MQPVERRPSLSPGFVLAFGILAVSSGSILVRYAQGFVPSMAIAAARLSIATLLLAPLALTKKRSELASMKRGELFLALVSGFFLALHFASWITSLEYTSVASSVVLVSTTPLWVALLAPFTVREPWSRPILIGMGIALAGSVLVGLSDACNWSTWSLVCPPAADFFEGNAFWGDLLALAGAWMAAVYVLIGRRLRARLSLVSYIFVVYGVAALVLLALMVAAGQTLVGYPASAYLWLILLAVLPQLLGHSSFNWALGYVSAALVSIALLGEPIGSTVLAYILLDETPSALKVFGAILILAGILMASGLEPRKVTPKNRQQIVDRK